MFFSAQDAKNGAEKVLTVFGADFQKALILPPPKIIAVDEYEAELPVDSCARLTEARARLNPARSSDLRSSDDAQRLLVVVATAAQKAL